jgi:hypothetical protein
VVGRADYPARSGHRRPYFPERAEAHAPCARRPALAGTQVRLCPPAAHHESGGQPGGGRRDHSQAGLREIVTEPLPITLPPGIDHQLVGPALAAAVEAGTFEARAYQHWLAAAQDAERGRYHSDTFLGMVVSARKPG